MKQYNRSNITEEPIISPIIDADRTQADHIRIQARILREARERQLSEQSQSDRAAMIDTDAEQRHRFKLRDQK